ncbi:MAG: hypothetical protein WDN44_11580 [Sphingomonas sp.]
MPGSVSALGAGHVDQGAAVGDFIRAVILLVVVQVVAAIVIAITAPKEAGARADARETGLRARRLPPRLFRDEHDGGGADGRGARSCCASPTRPTRRRRTAWCPCCSATPRY